MFFDRFEDLCKEKGVKPGTACREMGVSRSLAAKWKTTKTEKPSADVLMKMSGYFEMSIGEILGTETEKAPTPKGERQISDGDMMFALWGDSDEMDQADLDDVKRYADYVRERKRKK